METPFWAASTDNGIRKQRAETFERIRRLGICLGRLGGHLGRLGRRLVQPEELHGRREGLGGRPGTKEYRLQLKKPHLGDFHLC